MVEDCNKCKGSTPFGFFIISGFLLIWIITSLIPGVGIIGDFIFRRVIGIKILDYNWPTFSFLTFFPIFIPQFIVTLPLLLAAVLSGIPTVIIDCIPILGPIINFIRLWSKGAF